MFFLHLCHPHGYSVRATTQRGSRSKISRFGGAQLWNTRLTRISRSGKGILATNISKQLPALVASMTRDPLTLDMLAAVLKPRRS